MHALPIEQAFDDNYVPPTDYVSNEVWKIFTFIIY